MKLLHAERTLAIPEGVKVEIKGRRVRVTGPRGVLQKDFKHLGASGRRCARPSALTPPRSFQT